MGGPSRTPGDAGGGTNGALTTATVDLNMIRPDIYSMLRS
jgi:hypothetical protein